MYIHPLDMTFDFQFWRPAMQVLAHHACQAIRLAGDPVTRPNFRAFIGSLPLTSEERAGEPWRTTYCARCLLKRDEKFGAHWGAHDDCRSGRLCLGPKNALAEFGVEHIELPATPERIWRAIHRPHSQVQGR